jgi:hypothetical protein
MTGCAGVEIVRISSENPNQEGVRFYRPHPYLWVTKDKDDNLQGTIIWLPNKNEEYAIKVKSGIGSVDTKFKLADGWNLTEFGEVRDSKIPETITALTGSLKSLTDILRLARGEKPKLNAGLYELIFDDKTGLISDIKPVVQFIKDESPQKKPLPPKR